MAFLSHTELSGSPYATRHTNYIGLLLRKSQLNTSSDAEKHFLSFSLSLLFSPQNDIYCWRALSVVLRRGYGNLDAANKICTSNVSIKNAALKLLSIMWALLFHLQLARRVMLAYMSVRSQQSPKSALVFICMLSVSREARVRKENPFFSYRPIYISFHHKPLNGNIISNEIFMSLKL